MNLHEEIIDALTGVAPVTLLPDDLCRLASYMEHYQLVTRTTDRATLHAILVGDDSSTDRSLLKHRIPYHIYRSTMRALGKKPLEFTRWNRCSGMIHDPIETRQSAHSRWTHVSHQNIYIGQFVKRNIGADNTVWMIDDLLPDCRLVITNTGNRIRSTTNGILPLSSTQNNELRINHEAHWVLTKTA